MASRLTLALMLALPAAVATEVHDVALTGSSAVVTEDDSIALLQHKTAADSELHGQSHISRKTLTMGDVTSRSASETRPQMKDVRTAFLNLGGQRGDLLKANLGSNPPFQGYDRGYMPYSEHFQSVQRMQGSTTFYLAGSGEAHDGNPHSGQVFILDIPSKANTKGAMGSNDRPPAEDKLVAVMNIDKEYYHAGGMTSFDNILAVGCEPGCSPSSRVLGRCKTASRVHFFDTTIPNKPTRFQFVLEREGATAGTTSLTQQDNGKYLLVVGGADAAQLDFYLSEKTTFSQGDPGFRLITSWSKDSLLVDAGVDSAYNSYQTLNFIRQDDGSIFLVGLFRSMNGLGSDYADLFKVDSGSSGITMTKQGQIKLKCQSGTCNFQAAAGVYIASPETMLIYGADWEPNWKERAIILNEFSP